MVLGARRLTVRMMANELGMNGDSVLKILIENLDMRKMCAKMVPNLLSEDQLTRTSTNALKPTEPD